MRSLPELWGEEVELVRWRNRPPRVRSQFNHWVLPMTVPLLQ
ncbi:hypothetical protein [Nostoc sp. MG11]|nr:hypothetical protein [Nostoc sp. MG11]